MIFEKDLTMKSEALLTRRALCAALVMVATAARAMGATPVERWVDLTPPGWNPYAKMNPLLFGRLQDGSPEAVEAMQKIREVLDAAPTVPELEGRPARLPGFVVPLHSTRDGVSEFLLVPYFGACIHTPPPPANQIVYVQLKVPQKGLRTMEAIHVLGNLSLERHGTASGETGYLIKDATLERLR